MTLEEKDIKRILEEVNKSSNKERKEMVDNYRFDAKKSNNLLVHIMFDGDISEVGTAKAKVYDQQIMWRKRMWPIDKDAIPWIDRKGVSHLFMDINQSDGTYRFLEPRKLNLQQPEIIKCTSCDKDIELPFPRYTKPLDMCTQCGGSISYDARNVRDMLKRKTIDTFWGLDTSQILIIIIMGIVAIGCLGGLFYLLGQNQTLSDQLAKFQPKTPTNTCAGSGCPHFILGVVS